MKSVGWALFFCLMIFGQVFVVITLAEKKSRDERLAVLEEQTLKMNNEAAANRLESEKQRRVYYETLVNAGLFDRSFIDEDEARDIVRQGIKEE